MNSRDSVAWHFPHVVGMFDLAIEDFELDAGSMLWLLWQSVQTAALRLPWAIAFA